MEGLVPVPLSMVATIDIFLVIGRTTEEWLGLAAELDLQVMHIVYLVHLAASISSEDKRRYILLEYSVFLHQYAEAIVNKYIFHRVASIKCFLVEHLYIHLQMLF